MDLKKFIEDQMKHHPMKSLDTLKNLLELENIENYLNAFYGIELEIKVKPVKQKEGRWYGKSVLEHLK